MYAPKTKQHLGAASELAAMAWLLRCGYEVHRNTSPTGMADLIAVKGNETVKVDVKTIRLTNKDYRIPTLSKEQVKAGVKVLCVDAVHNCVVAFGDERYGSPAMEDFVEPERSPELLSHKKKKASIVEDHAPHNTPIRGARFTKVYDKGWDTISGMADNATAIKVYSFIAKHCDHLNALVVPVEVMADELEVSNRTVMRATKWLEEKGHLVIVKVGTANAYILDASDIWKNYDQYKSMCGFHGRVLASKAQNKNLKRRMTHYLGKPEQPDLLGED